MIQLYLALLDEPKEKSKFEALYYEYRELMRHIALGILKNNSLAEDAVHDAFLKLTHHLNGIDDIKSNKTKSFIVIIIKNVSLDMLEKEKRRSTYSFYEENSFGGVDIDFFENIELERIYSAVRNLPDTYGDIIWLKVYYCKSDREIADLMGISHSNVRKRLQRARNMLKKALGK